MASERHHHSKLLMLVILIAIGFFSWKSTFRHMSITRLRKDVEENSEDAITCPLYPKPLKLNFSDHPELNDLFAWLDEYLSSVVDNNTRPSVTANLVYMDKIAWSGNFGQLSKTNAERPTQDTIYRIASISKIFPVVFLFKLWEEGKVNLYDPITKYAPDFKVDPRLGKSDDINLIDIASQISGLPYALPFDARTETAVSFDGTLEEAFERLKTTVLLATPRSKCIYSNVGYALLAEVLARNFSGGNFEKWAQKNIVDALDLQNTGFFHPQNKSSQLATGYLPNGQIAPFMDINWYAPSGNYYSTASDLAKISMSFLETSKTILKHESLVEMLRTRKICQKGYIGGLADFTGSPWEMQQVHDYLVVRKDGNIFGYSSTMALVPDMKLAINVLMAGANPENIAIKVLEKVIPVMRNVLRSVERKGRLAPDPDKYVGEYTFHGVQRLEVTKNDNGGLQITNHNSPIPPYNVSVMDYLSAGIFRIWIKENGYPCNLLTNALNGALIQFKDFRNGKYNQFDSLDTLAFGFRRIDS